jgi:CubicO group peptidase (beta-lactamase class C family)
MERATAASDGWATVAPESVGFELGQLGAIDRAVRHGRLRNLHGVVVVRRGRLAFEQYWTGRDERWGAPLGEVTFGPETLHDLRSVSKSVVGLLYGIARAQGVVAGLDSPLLDAFPEYADLGADPARQRILVRHALTMTMGTEWDETLPYSDPWNAERRMEDAPDRCRFALDRPLVAAPGERWNYNGGATAILARMISRGTGRPLLDFATRCFFGPLGITAIDWVTDGVGEPVAASGLRLRPRDAARIGQLMLGRGRWGEREVVPASWVQESTRPHVSTTEPFVRYGYQWWLAAASFGDATTPWAAAFGNGGQRVFVLPELDLVVAVTAGNYNQPENWRLPSAVLNQFVLPALVGSLPG